jgi:hypothetical protein
MGSTVKCKHPPIYNIFVTICIHKSCAAVGINFASFLKLFICWIYKFLIINLHEHKDNWTKLYSMYFSAVGNFQRTVYPLFSFFPFAGHSKHDRFIKIVLKGLSSRDEPEFLNF